ncbi:MAG: hypothetical protein DRJ35_08645 [Thermoprotei archaeon]|nr:MAG: hypothetical protein DRJ35_08645 [Thermoprotei archaeon]
MRSEGGKMSPFMCTLLIMFSLSIYLNISLLMDSSFYFYATVTHYFENDYGELEAWGEDVHLESLSLSVTVLLLFVSMFLAIIFSETSEYKAISEYGVMGALFVLVLFGIFIFLVISGYFPFIYLLSKRDIVTIRSSLLTTPSGYYRLFITVVLSFIYPLVAWAIAYPFERARYKKWMERKLRSDLEEWKKQGYDVRELEELAEIFFGRKKNSQR